MFQQLPAERSSGPGLPGIALFTRSVAALFLAEGCGAAGDPRPIPRTSSFVAMRGSMNQTSASSTPERGDG